MSLSMKRPSRRKTERHSLPTEVGIVVTDLSLDVIAYDSGAAAILRKDQVVSEPDAALRLPGEVVETFQGFAPAELPATKTRFRRGKAAYSCRAYLMEPRNGAPGVPMLAMLLQRDSCADDAFSAVSMEYGLTDREEQVLRGLSMGLTTKELAARMNRSPNTIKMFLRLIMNKMRVTTRSGIVGKVLDHVE
jgi:DNA-binding CsgD family transcriptional regulator